VGASNTSTEPWPRDSGRSAYRTAVRRFVVAVLLATAVLALGTVAASRHVAEREALRDAEVTASKVAQDVAAKHVGGVRRDDDPAAAQRLGRAMRAQMREHSLRHVQLWDESGKVLWADRPSMTGRTFELSEPVRRLFGTTDAVTELTEGARAAPKGESTEKGLVEVYVGAEDLSGKPFVFESYTSPDSLKDNTGIIFWEYVWVGLGSLVLFAGATIPMAVSVARRVDAAQRHRSEILRQALRSSRHERRRLAQDVHDGVIQDLSAVGYALPTILDRLPHDPESEKARRLGEQINGLLVEGVTSLRALATDLLPPDLEGLDLEVTLQELAARAQASGIEVTVHVDEDVDAEPDILSMAHRCVREALQNVVKHSGATRAWVTVSQDGDLVRVRVVDDGRGLDGARYDEPGHLGLKLLADMLRELEGDLALQPRAEGGTVLTATMSSAVPV
jgi:signal transduction histidine kinase